MNKDFKGDFIKFLMEEGALKFGNFTLKSGLKSPFFINLGDIASGRALSYVGQALARILRTSFDKKIDQLYGPPYKGISLAAAAAISYFSEYGEDIGTFYSRKEAKTHGETGMFVGNLPKKGDRLVVIDDVLTTGGTKVEAIEQVKRTFDVEVAGIVVTVDRRTKNADAGLGNYPLFSIITLPEIADYLESIHNPNAALLRDYYEEKYHG